MAVPTMPVLQRSHMHGLPLSPGQLTMQVGTRTSTHRLCP